MKNLIIILISFYSAIGFALKADDIIINGGVGIFGTRGLVGVSVDKLYTANHAASAAVGLDLIGATGTVGYKYFGDKHNNSETRWGKCFFVLECDSHFFGGTALQYANGTSTTITESGLQREYTTDPKWLGLVSLGTKDVFKNNVTLEFEASYRHILSGGKATQVSGAPSNDSKLLELGFRNVGFSIAVGYLF